MDANSPNLIRASLQVDLALDDLEQAIVDRNVIELKLRRSFEKLAPVMKALDRRWDSADHAKYHRLFVKHIALQKMLTKVQNTCNQARQDFHDRRKTYDAARLAVMGRMIKSSEDMNHLQRCQGALNRTLVRFVDRLKSVAGGNNDKQTYSVRDGAYDYIPYDIPGFLSLLEKLDNLLAEDADYVTDEGRYRPVSFLEVGCGPGRNMLIARDCKLINLSSMTGFDINPDQLALGRQVFGLETELQVADAMSFDYSGFDVVFSFRPFQSIDKQRALEAHIARSMRKTAYLLAPFSHDLSLYHELTATGVSPDIWKKTG